MLGRMPHQGTHRRPTQADRARVDEAMAWMELDGCATAAPRGCRGANRRAC